MRANIPFPVILGSPGYFFLASVLMADTLLYDAKKKGRNRIEAFCSMTSFSPLSM